MSKIIDLRKYKETEEFKLIISKCKNRQENLSNQILEIYREGIATERSDAIYSNHDVNAKRMIFNQSILDDIKDSSEGANILRGELKEEIDRTETFLTLGIRDQYGITNSSQIFDTVDLIRCEMQDNRYFQHKLDGMIAALEKEEEKTPGLTSNDVDTKEEVKD